MQETVVSTKFVKNIVAVALDMERVVIAYNIGTATSTTAVYMCIAKINNREITLGTTTTITLSSHNESSTAVRKLALTVLNENKVLLFYPYNRLVYCICTIDDIKILQKTDTTASLNISYYSGNVDNITQVAVLNSSKIMFAFSYYYSSSGVYKTTAILCEINNLILTKINELELISSSGGADYYHYRQIKMIALNETQALMFYLSKTDSFSKYDLNAIILTQSGTTITKTTAKALTKVDDINNISIAKLSANKIVVAFGGNLKAVVCTIINTTVTKGTITELNTENLSGNAVSVIALNEDTIAIAHGSCLYVTICKIVNTEIIEESTLQLTTDPINEFSLNATKLAKNKIFISYLNSDNKAYSIVLDYLYNFVKKVTKRSEQICGVAMKKGTSNETIDIVVPDF